MRIAEQVTFGGSGELDRSAHLRGDRDKLQALWQSGNSRIFLHWRGKVLLTGLDTAELTLGTVGSDHALLRGKFTESVFLGQENAQAIFAADVSGWEPAELPDSLGAFVDNSLQLHPELPGSMAFAELRAHMTRLSASDASLAATAKAIFGWHMSHRFCAVCGHESEMVMAGWQRDCPSCGGHHFPRTDPVVIMLITHGDKLLLGRSPGWPDRMYSLLAGFVEPGETLEAAVRREVLEESGVTVGAVRYLASQPWPFPSSLMFGCKGEALGAEITLDPHELEDAFWITRDELADVFAGVSDRIAPARKGAIAQFLMQNWLADRLD